jgi:hypothetical protein
MNGPGLRNDRALTKEPADTEAISAATFSAWLATALAVAYLLYRWDVGSDWTLVAAVWGFAITLFAVTARLPTPVARSAATVLGLLVPLVLWPLDIDLRWLWIVAGVVMAAGLFRDGYGHPILASLAVAAVLVAYVFGSGIINPLSWERTVLGLSHTDTYAHFALSQMLAHYGLATFGFHGLDHTISYHFGSHLWLASLARMLGGDPSRLYHLVLIVVVYPAIFRGAVEAVQALGLHIKPLMVAAALLGALLVLPQIDYASYRGSEAQLVAILLLLLQLPLLIRMAAGTGESTQSYLGLVALAVVGSFLTLTVKVSAGMVLCMAYGWILLRWQGPRRITFWLGGVSLGVVALLVLLRGVGEGQGDVSSQLAPFAFYRFFASEDWPLYYLHALIPSVFAIAAGFYASRSGPDVWRRLAETLLVTTLVAELPGFVLNLRDGATWYFHDAARWLAIPGLLACVPVLIARWGSPPLRPRLIAIAVSGLLLVGLSGTAVRSAWDAVSFVASVRWFAAEKSDHSAETRRSWEYLLDSEWWRPGSVDAALHATPAFRLIEALEQARGGSSAAVFVPAGEESFWRLQPNCMASTLFIPALTGMPMVFGLGPASVCGSYQYYGMESADPSGRTQPNLSQEYLCAKAGRLENVLVVRQTPSWQIVRISCGPQPPS